MLITKQYKLECEFLVAQLKKLDCFPAYVQVARCEDISIVNVADRPFSAGLINTDIFVGFATDPQRAFSIALTEYVERRVCRNNPAMPSANEGVAGRSLFPGYDLAQARIDAAISARYEAIERHVWASWWDDCSLTSTIIDGLEDFGKGTIFSPLVSHVKRLFPGGRFIVIKPDYNDTPNSSVQIVFYFLPGDIGVVSGGACGSLDQEERVLFRALSELIRHAQALYRAKEDPSLKAYDQYNRRLLYFGSSHGAHRALSRLESVGDRALQLPPIHLDTPLSHPFESAVALHQCRFINQTEFIGGPLERLCL